MRIYYGLIAYYESEWGLVENQLAAIYEQEADAMVLAERVAGKSGSVDVVRGFYNGNRFTPDPNAVRVRVGKET